MADMMRAIEITAPGGPDALHLTERPIPRPGPGEVLIRTAGIGINRPDILQRMGLYPPPEGASDLPGLEVSGLVEACGSAVDQLRVGDAVCALLPGGGYADYAVADQGLCMPVPARISLRDAAGLPETVVTVWANLFEDGQLRAGETLLIHGATSGIGTMAIQMAKAHGASVMATASSDAKCAAAKALGADHAFRYDNAGWDDEVRAAGGADVVLDMAGGDFFTRNLACLKPGGRHVSIAFLRGSTGEIDIFALMRKRLRITGSTLRARTNAEKAALCGGVVRTVWPWISEGKLAPKIDRVFSLAQAETAHRHMEAAGHIGKILLEP